MEKFAYIYLLVWIVKWILVYWLCCVWIKGEKKEIEEKGQKCEFYIFVHTDVKVIRGKLWLEECKKGCNSIG